MKPYQFALKLHQLMKMKPSKIVLSVCSIFLLCSFVFAEETLVFPALSPELLAAKPVSLVSDHPEKHLKFTDGSPKNKPASWSVAGTIKDKTVFSVVNQVPSKLGYNVEASWPITSAVKKGDAVLLRFATRARKVKQESGEASLDFYFQEAKEPWDKSISVSLGAGADWTVFEVPFAATGNFEAGQAVACLGLAQLEQTVEFTNFELLNFGDRVPVKKLPATRFTYEGREADAPWRAEALKRIEKLRTETLTIKVVDAAGQPVKGAKVDAAMTQSAFLFGSAVGTDPIIGSTPDAERYRKTFLDIFDTATIDGNLKWYGWIVPSERNEVAPTVEWLAANNIRLRGHTLVWPGFSITPSPIKNDPGFPANLKDKVEAHIRDVATTMKGKVIEWDVVNEPIHERDFFKQMPEDTMVHWFNLAHELDPNAKLFINEYGMISGNGSTAMIKEYLTMIRSLRAKGAKIDGMGVQGHIGQKPQGIPAVLVDYDLLATEKLPLEITEFDINTSDEELQADYTRDLLIATYSHPAFKGFVMWGFYESWHWRPLGAMYRADWSEKPNAKVWRDLVVNQWKTKVNAITGDDGSVSKRAHFGRYHVVVTTDDKKAVADFELTKETNTVLIHLN